MDKNEGPLHKPPAGTEEPRYVVDSKKPTDTPPEQNSIWREILPATPTTVWPATSCLYLAITGQTRSTHAPLAQSTLIKLSVN
jgi:hypothetical protein